MVDSISSSLAAGGLSQAVGGDDTLGQEAFLRLLVAQLQNQDPLNPQENHEFVAQLAQFSSLEQTIGINERLDQLALQNTGLQNAQVVNLVGKQATVQGNVVTLEGQGASVPIIFNLSDSASETSVQIRDSSGRLVRTLSSGPRSAGSVTLQWDGQDDTGLAQPAGPYQITASAENAAGGPVALTQQSEGLIESVSFDRGFPVLHLNSGVAVPVADLIEVAPSENP